MTFKPNTAQLECIAELAHARAPVAKIAAELGIGEDEFKAWSERLAAARMFGMPTFGATVKPPGSTLGPTEVDRLFAKP